MAEIEGVAAPPPNDSVASKPGPPTPSNAPLRTAEMLLSWLPLYLEKTDSTIAHLRRILSHPSTTDSLLCTLQYSTLAASALLSTLSRRRRLLLLLLSLSSPAPTALLLASPASLAAAAAAPPPPPQQRLLRLSHALQALSAQLSDARTFARLWGLLALYESARALAARPPPDAALRRIAAAQLAVGLAYQLLENGAYLADKGVLRARTGAAGGARAWRWSARCWMAHVGLELLRLGYVRWKGGRRRQRRRQQLRRGEGRRVSAGWGALVAVDGEEEPEVVQEKEEEEEEENDLLDSQDLDDAAWTRDLISNVAYAPLTVHWSLEKGLVGDLWIGILGTVAGGVRFVEAWKNTA